MRVKGGIKDVELYQQKLYALADVNKQNYLRVININNLKIEKNIPLDLKKYKRY